MVDLSRTVCNDFISMYRFIHISFRIGPDFIHISDESLSAHFLSGDEQGFLRRIIFLNGLKRSADTKDIPFQTRNIGTVTGSEDVRHPVFITDDTFLRVDLYNPQMHQLIDERSSAAVQTNDSKLSHVNNCHNLPRPFRSQPERLPLSSLPPVL